MIVHAGTGIHQPTLWLPLQIDNIHFKLIQMILMLLMENCKASEELGERYNVCQCQVNFSL